MASKIKNNPDLWTVHIKLRVESLALFIAEILPFVKTEIRTDRHGLIDAASDPEQENILLIPPINFLPV